MLFIKDKYYNIEYSENVLEKDHFIIDFSFNIYTIPTFCTACGTDHVFVELLWVDTPIIGRTRIVGLNVPALKYFHPKTISIRNKLD